MDFNNEFVANEDYRPLATTKHPSKELVIVSCMDTRLTELLPKAMNIANGDAKIIKVAGAVINHPFGSVMRSILVAVHALGAEEVMVIGHDDCGMANTQPDQLLSKMIDGGVDPSTIEMLEHAGLNFQELLKGFDSIEASVEDSVQMVRNHPLIPKRIKVSGLVINPETGALRVVVDGYQPN